MDSRTISFSRLLAESYRRWTGEEMLHGLSTLSDKAAAEAIDQAPFGLVAHGTQADPIFCYGNQMALALFEMSWDEFTAMPSRLSAPPAADMQDDRNRLMAEALKKGYVENYHGVRISKMGRRFEITDTILWNVVDAQGNRHGQAALIRDTRRLHSVVVKAGL